jgi:predicted TIM-barrel fold metal-dependent hydrolase
MHLCNFHEIHYPWLESPTDQWLLGPYRSIARDFLLEDFLSTTGDIEVTKIVHIENGPSVSDRLAETRWLQTVLDGPSSGGRPNGIVAGIDLSLPDAELQLKEQRQFRTVRGVRQILNVHPNSHFDFVGRHFMRDSTWLAGFAQLSRYDLSFDLQIYPSQMQEAADLAARYPDIQIVLNHTGMFVDRTTVAGWRDWRDGIRKLSKQENVAVKISGMGMLDHKWTVESIRPYVLETIDCFGVDRAMFASNFPVDGIYASYEAIWHAFAQCVCDMADIEKDQLFRLNAERIYRI